MPSRRKDDIYQRGQYWLAYDRKSDGTLRTPFLTIFWYDAQRGRQRSKSAGTTNVQTASSALDSLYVETVGGAAVCSACGQEVRTGHGFLLADAISNYLSVRTDVASAEAVRARLAHVVAFIQTLARPPCCEDVDEIWIAAFRKWNMAQPIITPSGNRKVRSASTVEGSVRQLSAAINHALRRRDTLRGAAFTPKKPKDTDRKLKRRLSISEIANAMRYAAESPNRINLLRFLRASISTVARPDAMFDLSTDPAREQWDSERRILQLNPKGRVQTKKFRATIVVPAIFASELDATQGLYLTVGSINSSWKNMCRSMGWKASEGELGIKLVRRSMAQLIRDRLPENSTPELQIQLGHRRTTNETDLYAEFKPGYLKEIESAISGIIDEIEQLAPGAFYRKTTGDSMAATGINSENSVELSMS